jgi:hypothetical protein
MSGDGNIRVWWILVQWALIVVHWGPPTQAMAVPPDLARRAPAWDGRGDFWIAR